MNPTIAVLTGAAGDFDRALSRWLTGEHDVVLMADIDELAAISPSDHH